MPATNLIAELMMGIYLLTLLPGAVHTIRPHGAIGSFRFVLFPGILLGLPSTENGAASVLLASPETACDTVEQ